MITYKVTWEDDELITEDWDEAVDAALFWKCDTILELLNGKPHAYVEPNEPRTVSEQDRAMADSCARSAERLRAIGKPIAAHFQELADDIREMA